MFMRKSQRTSKHETHATFFPSVSITHVYNIYTIIVYNYEIYKKSVYLYYFPTVVRIQIEVKAYVKSNFFTQDNFLFLHMKISINFHENTTLFHLK